MGAAMVGGILAAEVASPEQIMVADTSEVALARLEAEYGVSITKDVASVVKASDVLVLAIKPQVFPELLPAIAPELREGQLVISIAAGMTMAKIESLLGAAVKLIRVMPNTPALVGEAMSAYCGNANVDAEDLATARLILEAFGQAEQVSEPMMDVVTGISGSSPAYVYMFIEAMADAAVADGMPRATAYKFAAQAVLGSAKMVLETGEHPGILKDRVCSPGGTTIEAVAVLEERGFRSTVIEAQRACVAKSREMGK